MVESRRPPLALVALVASWDRDPSGVLLLIVSAGLVAAVIAAVHHAEVVALRVGEPFGTLILAVAVTVIEVGLIITLTISGESPRRPWLGTPCSPRS